MQMLAHPLEYKITEDTMVFFDKDESAMAVFEAIEQE
jgi:hypothetical protein